MEKTKKIKLFIGLFYILAVVTFLYFLFKNFSLQEITTYEFIKNNRDYFSELRIKFIFLGIIFILFTIIWTLALGFGSPLGLFAGFIFGKWFGLLFAVIGMSLGATLLLHICQFLFKRNDKR